MRVTTTGLMIGIAAFAAASAAVAQDPTSRIAAQRIVQLRPAVSMETTGAIDRVPLQAGKNSFTESQARARIERDGFTHVGALVLDKQGIWRGTARNGAMTVDIGLDFEGNIAADNARAK